MKKNFISAAAAFVTAILISGCGKNSAPDVIVNAPLPEPPLVASCPPGRSPADALVIATYGDPKTLQSHHHGE